MLVNLQDQVHLRQQRLHLRRVHHPLDCCILLASPGRTSGPSPLQELHTVAARLHGPKAFETLFLANPLVICWTLQGSNDLNGALTLQQRALAETTRWAGSHNDSTSDCQYGVGLAYLAMGKHAEVLPQLERAHEGGSDEFDLVEGMQCLASMYITMGNTSMRCVCTSRWSSASWARTLSSLSLSLSLCSP